MPAPCSTGSLRRLARLRRSALQLAGLAGWVALAPHSSLGAQAPGRRDAGDRTTLTVGTLVEPVTLEPHRATDLVSSAIVANVCETLVTFSSDATSPKQALATSWATADNRTWTFTLREQVRFHDGTPFDADAVVANIEHLRRERAFPGRARRAGPHAISIRLERPDAALLATLSQPYYSMQSPAQLDAEDVQPIGTGPFRFRAWRAGDVELESNGDYWNGPPKLRRLVFRRLPDPGAVGPALAAGTIDVTAAVDQERVGSLRRMAGIVLESRTGLNIAFLSVNNEHPPLDNVKVRQAIAHTIDRAALVKELLGGHGLAAHNPLPPSLWGYATTTRELLLDPPLARHLLEEAGHARGFDTTILAVDTPRPYMAAPLRLTDRVRADLERVGIRARVRRVDTWSEYTGLASNGDYDLAVIGWQADTTDPNDFLSTLLGSEAIGTTNRSRYRSPTMDALLGRGRREIDPAQRLATYHAAQELFQKDMPWVPLYHVSVFTARRDSVRGLTAGPTGIVRYDRAWKE